MAAAVGSGGWWGLAAILREAAQEVRAEQARPPIACPHDGEPLREGPRGGLYCPYDGFQWPRDRVQ